MKISPPETDSDKNTDIFHISTQNIDIGHSLEPPLRGGSNEYTQSMFLSSNKKSNAYPWKLQFYYIKVGFKGVKIIKACFRDDDKSNSGLSFLKWIFQPMNGKIKHNRGVLIALYSDITFLSEIGRRKFTYDKEFHLT